MHIQEAVEHYILQLVQLNKSPHTVKQYRIDLNQFMTAAAEADVYDVTTSTFRTFAIQYEDVLREKGFKPTSIRRKISSLRSFITYLATAHFIEEDFKDLIVHTESYEVTVRIPTIHEVGAVYQFYDDPSEMVSYDDWLPLRNRTVTQLMIDTGMKVAEVKRLTVGHLELEHGTLQLLRPHLTFVSVPLPRKTVRDLRRYMERTAQLFQFEWQPHHALFFSDRGMMDEPLSERTVERIIERATASLGTDARGSELRYFRLVQRSLQREPAELAEQFGYTSLEPLLQRLSKIKKKD